MPIEYFIDHNRRLVLGKATGILCSEDLFKYQREVWALPEVKGYNELMDMTAVENVVSPNSENIKILADLSASMDETTIATKFAIVAPENLLFGLGRMYETYRSLNPKSTKEVCVFRSMHDAMEWLGNK